MALPATRLRPAAGLSPLAGMQELYEDCPEQFSKIAELFSRAGRPAFGSVEVKFERGKVCLVVEHVTHK